MLDSVSLPLVLALSGLLLCLVEFRHVKWRTVVYSSILWHILSTQLVGLALALATASIDLAVDSQALIGLTALALFVTRPAGDPSGQGPGGRTIPYAEMAFLVALVIAAVPRLPSTKALWPCVALAGYSAVSAIQLKALESFLRPSSGQTLRPSTAFGYNALTLALPFGCAQIMLHAGLTNAFNVLVPVFNDLPSLGLDTWVAAVCQSVVSLLAFHALARTDTFVLWTSFAVLRSIAILGGLLWSSALSETIHQSLPLMLVTASGVTVLARARLLMAPTGYRNLHAHRDEDGALRSAENGVTLIVGNASLEKALQPPTATSISTFDRLFLAVAAFFFASSAFRFGLAPIDFTKIDTRGNRNFIVVTTISAPTDTMKVLCSLSDWEVVVVADTKTPKEWSSGACHYISVLDQKRLPLQTPRLIPYRAYTRKNIGYLYAIALGAEIIFDTDDDNTPNQAIRMRDVSDDSFLLAYTDDIDKEPSINPYAHFGRPDIWPRGYPLNKFDSSANISFFPTSSAPSPLGGRALVQQGLADLDPDVDAIFRLINAEDVATVRFCRNVPPIKLARGVMTPFNSQNTLWHKDAFIGLLLPISVTFRATDIVRSYWVQRLLWDINGLLAFDLPTVDQIRNPHDYLLDMDSEMLLYLDVPMLIGFLQNWKSDSLSLDQRMLDLLAGMVDGGFIKKSDLVLARAWVADLRKLRLPFPSVQPWDKEQYLPSVVDARTLIPEEDLQEVAWRADACAPANPRFDDVLLLTSFPTAAYDAAPALIDLHDRFFPNHAFYGPHDQVEEGVFKVASTKSQHVYYRLLHAIDAHASFAGYLWLNATTAVNPYALAMLDKTKLWLAPALHTRLAESDTRTILGIEALPTHLRTNLNNRAFTGQTDFAYIPRQFLPDLRLILRAFNEHAVPLETALPTAMRALQPELDFIIYMWLIRWSRRNTGKRLIKLGAIGYMHAENIGHHVVMVRYGHFTRSARSLEQTLYQPFRET